MRGLPRPGPLVLLLGAFSQRKADAFLHKLDVEMESVSVGAVEQTLMAELALIGRDDHLQVGG